MVMSIKRNKMLRHRNLLLMIAIIVGIAALLFAIVLGQRFSSMWERSWLMDVPCRAPCWEGITPSKTTVTETLQLLAHNLQVGTLSYFQSDKDTYDEVFWSRWKNNAGGGRIVYDRITSMVSRVSLSFPHDFTLEEVIQAYGEPSHVLALAARNLEKLNETDYRLEIFWQSHGIMLEWAQEYPSRRPIIDQNLKFHSVGFFEPTATGLEHAVAMANPVQLKFLEPWKGLVDFREYCHSVDVGGGVDPQACETNQPQ
jgi:hypothetical protein